MNRLLTLLAAVASIGASAQTMQAEYFVDTDPGLGNAIRLAVPTDAEGNGTLQFTIPKDQLPTGRHLIGVRTFIVKDVILKDKEGNDSLTIHDVTQFSPTVTDRIDIFQPSDRKPLMYLEYFWDGDPGYGKGTQIALPADMEATLDKLPIPTEGLASGHHRVGVRIRGGEGWSPTIVENVVVISPEDFGKILKMEYFWDVDPGYGEGTSLTFEAGEEVTLDNVVIPMPEDGLEHKLGLRGFGDNKWGPTFIYDTSTPPRYMNDDDLAALRALYNATGGAQWSGSRWNTELTEIRADNWSGVSFNADDRVSAINLKAKNLTGTLQEALPALPEMTSLNLSQNALKGDPAIFVSKNTQLTELNLSYNQFDELSEPLSLNLSDKLLSLSYQHRVYNNDKSWPGLDQLTVSDILVGRKMDIQLPRIATYKHGDQSFIHPKLMVYNPSNYKEYGTLTWQENIASYAFKSSVTTFDLDDGSSVIIQPASGNTLVGSAYPGVMRFVPGDANMSGGTDINDVVRTLNLILGKTNQGVISLWAANTFSEGETSRVINIQDIVCTVNIVLANQSGEAAEARRFRSMTRGADRNLFFADGRSLNLEAADSIAAFDLELEGADDSQVRLMLNARDWQMMTCRTANGVRLVVFSPTGATLPVGQTTQLLRMSSDGVPVAVQASSPDATSVMAAVSGGAPTGIHALQAVELQASARDGRISLLSSARCGRTLVSLYNTQGVLLSQHQLTELNAGQTVIGEGLPQTSGLIIMTVSNEEIGTKIYKLQMAK